MTKVNLGLCISFDNVELFNWQIKVSIYNGCKHSRYIPKTTFVKLAPVFGEKKQENNYLRDINKKL